jgi:hypothetical protein
MTVVVSFIRATGAGVIGVGGVRAQERVTVPGTTVTTALNGEVVIIGNGETSMVAAAWGSTPDAAATAETTATSASVAVPAGGLSYPINPKFGDKVNIKVVT